GIGTSSATEVMAFQHPETTPFSSSWTSIFTDTSAVDVTAVAIGDFNGVNGNDVVYVSGFDNRVEFQQNDGSGGFTSAGIKNFDETGGPYTITNLVAYDFDGANGVDVIASSNGVGANIELQWLKNDGSGDDMNGDMTVTDIASINVNMTDMVVDDFDADGDGDIAVAGTRVISASEIYVVENEGSDVYETFIETTLTGNVQIEALVLIDLGNTGYTDNLDIIFGLDDGTANAADDEIQVLENTAIPEFTTLLAPIVSVIGIVLWNYRRRQPVEQ
ncbi:MAG: hypothetical protein QF678_04675, partial [Candidatus Poseidoniia archaeon]|nr:hypothetical protein [Candidatus Poseidoniia archaeon]